jgi:hypothetical protein
LKILIGFNKKPNGWVKLKNKIKLKDGYTKLKVFEVYGGITKAATI